MRLSDYEKSVIFKAITAEDANAKVFLYGSRTDNNARGGDIDLLVLSKHFNKQKLRAARWRIVEQILESKK
ncbi:nucleotidyltransferase domain-containing protein [Alishewanella longhuensis]